MLTAVLIAAAAVIGFKVGRNWERTSGRTTTFDEHTATALALLQPDDPALPQPLSFIEQVEAYVAAHAPEETK